jgi:hypothetical protein
MQVPLIELIEEKFATFDQLLIVGDVHGDIATLNAIISKTDLRRNGLLFLGDYADRGDFGVEVIETISYLRDSNPGRVFLLKGNHEDYSESGTPKFHPCKLQQEVEKKKGDWIDYFNNELKPFIESLSLAAIIPGDSLFVHGGVSSKILGIETLRNPTIEIERDILWSDPFDGLGERPNAKRGGSGVQFGSDITNNICQLLNIKRIIRSHEPSRALFEPNYTHDNRVVTISSTRVYRGLPFLLSINYLEPLPKVIAVF